MSGEPTDKNVPKHGRACALCRKHKTRCIGGLPCRRCIESNVICAPQPPPSKSLAERVASLENKQHRFLRKLKAAQQEIRELRGDGGSPSEDSFSSGEDGSNDVQERKASRRSLQHGTLDPVDSTPSEPYAAPHRWLSANEIDRSAGPSRGPSNGDATEEGLDLEEDLTMIDAIRLGKRTRSVEVDGMRAGKRARVATFDIESEEGRVMEKVSLDIFYSRCASKLPFVDPANETALEALRKRSSLYYWAIIATGSREAEELAPIHRYAQDLAIKRARETLFGNVATMDDLKGLLTVNTYLSQLRSPGHLVGIMHELELGSRCSGLVQGFEALRGSPGGLRLAYREDKELASCLRVFGWLVVVDRMTAVLNGRPNLIQTERKHMITNVINMINTIQYTDSRRVADIELCALAEVSDMLAQLRETFSAYHGPIQPEDVAIIPGYNDALDQWYRKWTDKEENPILKTFIRNREDELAMGRCVHSIRYVYSASKLHINTFPLRGVKHASQLSEQQLVCLRAAVVSARGVCLHAVKHNQPNNILYSTNITQLQLTFAAIFLLRMLRLLPGEIEDPRTIVEEIRALAGLLSEISGRYFARRIGDMLRYLEEGGGGGRRRDSRVGQETGIRRGAGPTYGHGPGHGHGHGLGLGSGTGLVSVKRQDVLPLEVIRGDAPSRPSYDHSARSPPQGRHPTPAQIQQQQSNQQAQGQPQESVLWSPDFTHEWDADLGTASFWAWMQDGGRAEGEDLVGGDDQAMDLGGDRGG